MKRLRQLPIFILVALLASITFSTSTLAANRDEVIFFFNDALGSAVATVNESGELCWSEQYTGYGDKTINDDLFNVTGCGIVGEERGFTGHTEDVNSDLVYMQQRYYDPSIGRFLSVDPVAINPEEPTTYNRYAYANNNPHKYVDPDGRFAETAWDVFNVALGTASFLSNISEGNYGSAALDAVGVVIDSAAAITPIAFGGVGTLINSRRLADVPKGSEKLYHYTDSKGLDGITSTNKLNPSLKANNPNDARYGDGQYLSDIAPGAKSCGQLSRCFFGNPFQGKKVENYKELDVRGLNVQKGRDGVYVVPGDKPLDLTNRITGSGKN